MAVMTDIGAKLIEITPLDRLQGIGDAVQLGVLRRVFPDPVWGALAVRIETFEARAILLAPEAPKPDAGSCRLPPPINGTVRVLRFGPRILATRWKSS